ncbi:MAG: M28 family peptidase, partial [Cyanobacteria bacterium]|nr:M28 family peptidase [Cyanobacteriota bacterium]
MIGYFTEAKNSQHYPPVIRWFYPSRGNFIGMVGDFASFNWIQKSKLGMKRYADLPVRSVSAPNVVPGIDFSDHQNYTQYGWPALMVTDTAFYRNHHYHKNSDTIETLNFPKMAQVVKGLYGLIINV